MKNKKMICIILALLIVLGIGVVYMMNNTGKEISSAEKTEDDQTNELPVIEFEETDSSDKEESGKTEIIVSGNNGVFDSDSNGNAAADNTDKETSGSNDSQVSEKPSVSQNETVSGDSEKPGESSEGDIQIAENGDIILPAVPLD